MLKHLVFLFFLISFSSSIYSQKIRIIDYYTHEPIPNAHICTESSENKEVHFWVSNVDGTLINTLKNPSTVVVSFMGYQTLKDSLNPNKSATFKIKPSVEQITEVVVTGQFRPETKDKSIYNVQVINKLDIQNKAANTLADLLANELNIKVENNGVLGSSISMQGLTGEHIKILVDGVPVIGRQNGNIDLNQLNMQNVDHIEIIEGPMSVIYGSNALAGAINIITKKNTRPKFMVGANTYYESVGVYNADAIFTKNINNHYFNITSGRNFFNGFAPSGSIRGNSEMGNSELLYEEGDDFDPKEQYFGTLDYGFNKNKIKINLSQDFFREEIRNYGPIDSLTPTAINDTLGAFYPTARNEYHYTNRANTKADLLYKINESTLISFLAAYSYYNKAKNTKLKDMYLLESSIIPDSLVNDTSVFNSYTSRGILTKSFEKVEFGGGYDVNIETGKGKRITDTKRIDDYAAFFNIKYDLLKNLSLQGGGRFIKNSKYDAPIVYSINIKYDPLEKLNLRFSYGTGFRSPSLKELYLDFVDLNHQIQGNPNLKAEYSKSLNFSVNYGLSKGMHLMDYSLKLYHTQLKNKIDFIFYPDQPTKADYSNIEGIYKTIGGQFDVTYRLHPRLKLTSGINYYGNSKLSNLNEYTYTTDYTLAMNYSNVKYGFKVNAYIKHNGEQRQFTNQGTPEEPDIVERYWAGYNMMDVSVARPFFSEKLSISTGIKNIFNVTNIVGSGSGGGAHTGGSNGKTMSWGRTFFVKLNFNITQF